MPTKMSLLPLTAKIIGVIFTAYATYAAYYYAKQRSIIFPAHLIPVPAGDTGSFPDLEKIWLDTSVGRVEAWFLPPLVNVDSKPSPAILIGHGNGELIDYWAYAVGGLRELGFGVLLVEYPGYGRSQGTPTRESIAEAYITAYDMIAAREDIDPSRIALFGRSIGGGAVCDLAAARPSGALILMSTFTSIKELASRRYLPHFLIRDRFDNLAVVHKYPGEVLVLHGTRDEIIPYDMGVKLYQAAMHGTMITYDCGHNDCISDWDDFWGDIEPFLRANVLAP